MKSHYNILTQEEQRIILNKGTERAFSGEYHDLKDDGTYKCKQCNSELFYSDAKFDSGTGWPSFDDSVKDSVQEIADADGRRVEIVCSSCGGHLGHVFKGEAMTPKSVRHCANSASLKFEKK